MHECMDNNRRLLNKDGEAESDITKRITNKQFIEYLIGEEKAAIVLLVSLIHHALDIYTISLFLSPRFSTMILDSFSILRPHIKHSLLIPRTVLSFLPIILSHMISHRMAKG